MPTRSPSRKQLQAMAIRIARAEGVPVPLFLALIQQESGWNPTAGSSAGARGLTQLMPGTAQGLGVTNILNPEQNLRGGARYLRQQLDRFGTPQLALSAYNSGPGGAEASGQVEGFSETRNYVQRVMALERQYAGMGGGAPPFQPQAAPAGTAATQPQGFTGALLRPITSQLGTMPSTFGAREKLGPLTRQTSQDIQSRGEIPAQRFPGMAEGALAPQAPPDQPFDSNAPAVGGMNAEFLRRFRRLQVAVQREGGTLTIYSGARDAERQAQLWRAAVAKYGSEAEARKWVAPPGKSNHDPGAGLSLGLGQGALAADIRGDIALAHKLAPKFGLTFPLGNEPWHMELAGIRDIRR